MSQRCLPIPRHHPNRKRRRNNSSNDDVTNENSDSTTPAAAGFGSIETMDATEYLFQVVQQAKGLPDVFVAAEEKDAKASFRQQESDFVPIDGSAASLSYLLSGRTELMRPPSIHHLPKDCSRWMEQSITNFECMRHYLATCKEQGIGGKKTKRLAFPAMKNQDGWLTFCLGANWNTEEVQQLDGNDVNMADNDTTATESTATEESIPLWKRDIPEKGHEPWVRIVLQIDQVLLRRVLAHVGHFICNDLDKRLQKQDEVRHSHALKWMYSLLARLEFPIHRDDAAMLFQLLKALTRARSCLVFPTNAKTSTTPASGEQAQKRLAEWNLLIVLIGVFFEQGGGSNNLMTCAEGQ
ncbi:MAG: hypothetical protein SGBAC_010051 [Bacillariaceae sp.]